MTVEEIIRGESKNIEFKEMLPKNSERYIKTIVAFANSQGGRLLIGVADETREIVGVDESNLFRLMDSISNAVSDSCEPQIVPEIEPYTIDGRTVVVITVSPEPHRPYYLKEKGKDRGTYIRVAGTTRPASPEKIKELEMEGSKISWDELLCVDYPVKTEAIQRLCRDIDRYRREMSEHGHRRAIPAAVSELNLENWNILKKTSSGYLATNAFALLTGTHFRYSKTLCAVFAGTERGEFIDKQDYTGPLYEQIESAYAFVLRNIHRRAKVDGLIRRERYELPPNAIREMIINAHCHRNFADESCVQIALYDDRLEVTSPGGLYNGLTLEEALSGRSRQRNHAIAEIFNQMGLIEAWGNGLRSICSEAKTYGLRKPEFQDMPETFRVNLFRNAPAVPIESGKRLPDAGNVGNVGENVGDVGDIRTLILSNIQAEPTISAATLAERLSVTPRTIERYLRGLKASGKLVRHGTARGGYWEVIL